MDTSLSGARDSFEMSPDPDPRFHSSLGWLVFTLSLVVCEVR